VTATTLGSAERCSWAGSDPAMVAYHDEEWGVPVHDDARLLEFLVLEGAQAGLSWSTVLRKRDRYREVFHGFDPERVAAMGPADVERLLQDAGIIRHRGKIEAAIANARAVMDVIAEHGDFASWIWDLAGGEPVQNRWTSLSEMPASTPVAARMSRELKRRGFRFVGPTTCYAFMQATGMVHDHVVGCFRHAEVARLGGRPG
jgi:DNA-3-methyladenine glycosylase I